jgi:hypothetical protein
VLEAWLRAPTTEQRDVLRARIILLAAEGRSTRSIARMVGTMPRTVSMWRGRFARKGLAGLADQPRPGPAPNSAISCPCYRNRVIVVSVVTRLRSASLARAEVLPLSSP